MIKKIFFTSTFIFTFVLSSWISPAFGKLAVSFYKGHENGRVTGFKEIDTNLLKPHPLESRFFTENWYHEIQFPDQEIIVIVNFQLSNLGFTKNNFDVYLTVSEPGSDVIVNRVRIKKNEVQIDQDGLSISLGQSRMAFKGDRYYLKSAGENIQCDFTFKPLTGSFFQGDGTVRFEDSGDFVRHTFPIPWAEVTGRLTYNGKTLDLKGWGSLNRDRQILFPTRFMRQWRVFWMYSKEGTVSMVRCSAPDLDGKWVQRLLLAVPGRILFSSHDYTLEELDKKPVPGSKIPCPRRYRLEAVHGEDWLRGDITINRIQEKRNILADFPLIFQKIASLFVAESWTYRSFNDFRFEYQVDGKRGIIEGKGTGNYIDSIDKEN